MKLIHNIMVVAGAAALLVSCAAPKDDIDRKVDDLLSKMTLAEKIGQMNQLVGPKLTGIAANKSLVEKVRRGIVGSVLNMRGPEVANLQKVAVEESRLGIPLIFGLDVIHGYETCFPVPLAMASSWNMKDIEKDVQKVTDTFCDKVDAVISAKEKEIMSI